MELWEDGSLTERLLTMSVLYFIQEGQRNLVRSNMWAFLLSVHECSDEPISIMRLHECAWKVLVWEEEKVLVLVV